MEKRSQLPLFRQPPPPASVNITPPTPGLVEVALRPGGEGGGEGGVAGRGEGVVGKTQKQLPGGGRGCTARVAGGVSGSIAGQPPQRLGF